MANEIKVELDLETKDASTKLDKFTASAQKSGGAMKLAFLGAAGAVAAIGIAGIAAAVKLTKAFISTADAASIQEDAVHKMNTALKLAGDYSKAASQDFQNFASELQQMTTVGDETTLEMLSLAKAMGASNEQAKEMVKAAVNLSAATGMALEGAVKNLGKTFAGMTGELGESVPALRSLSAEALKSGAAIKMINDRFGGAAAAQVQTYSGALQQTKNTFGDLQEVIGDNIIKNKVVIALIQQANKVFLAWQDVVKSNSDIIKSFVNTALLFGVKVIIKFIESFQWMNNIISSTGQFFDYLAGLVLKTGRAFLTAAQATLEFFGQGDKAKALEGNIKIINKAIEQNEEAVYKSMQAQEQRNALIQEFVDKAKEGEAQIIAASQESASKQEEIDTQRIEAKKEKLTAFQEFEKELQAIKDEEDELRLTAEQEAMVARFDEKLMAHEEHLTQQEIVQAKFEARELIRAGKHQEAVKKLEAVGMKVRQKQFAEGEKKMTELGKLQSKARETGVSDSLNTIATLQTSGNRKLFYIGKAAALATAVIDGLAAVQKAWNTPWPLNLALVPLVATAVGANIAKIAASQPPSKAKAGLDEVPEDNMTFIASKGERILDSQTNQDLKDFLRNPADNTGRSGGNIITVNFNGDTLSDDDALKEQLAEGVADAIEYQNVREANG